MCPLVLLTVVSVPDDGDTITEEDVFKWIEQEEYSSDEIIIPESGSCYEGYSKNLTDKAMKSRAEGEHCSMLLTTKRYVTTLCYRYRRLLFC